MAALLLKAKIYMLQNIFTSLIELHKEAFDEEPFFIEQLLKTQINESNCFFIEKNNCIATVLYALTKHMNFFGKKVKCKLFSSIATKKEYRGQGLCRANIKNALQTLNDSGVPFVFLNPFNFEFYEKLGFTTVSDVICGYNESEYKKVGLNISDYKKLIPVYNEFNKNKVYITRSNSDFKFLIRKDYRKSEKYFLLIKNNKTCGCCEHCGYVIDFEDGFKEIIFPSRGVDAEGGRGGLANGKGFVKQPFGMARICNIHSALKNFLRKDLDYDFNIGVTDNFLDFNNVVFNIKCKNGVLTIKKIPAQKPGGIAAEKINLTAQELTLLLLGKKDKAFPSQSAPGRDEAEFKDIFYSFEFFMTDRY